MSNGLDLSALTPDELSELAQKLYRASAKVAFVWYPPTWPLNHMPLSNELFDLAVEVRGRLITHPFL